MFSESGEDGVFDYLQGECYLGRRGMIYYDHTIFGGKKN